jgi:hypothetical protein
MTGIFIKKTYKVDFNHSKGRLLHNLLKKLTRFAFLLTHLSKMLTQNALTPTNFGVFRKQKALTPT